MRDTEYRSKRSLLIFILLISLVCYLLGRYQKDYPFKKHIIRFFDPLFYYSSIVIQETRETLWALFHFYQLKEENMSLSGRILELEKKNHENEFLRIENDRLNEIMNFRSHLKFEVIPARIIGFDSSNWEKSIIINKGEEEGVSPNHAVITPRGIAGKVVESYRHSSKVMLLLDNESKVGGMVLRTSETGILEGQDKDYCMLNYLSRNADIKKGDLVISSGFDSGLFPKGIILGEVQRVFSEDFGLFKYAEVIPSVNFSRLEEVLVIRGSPGPENAE